jgi:hypothetical protein
MILWISLVRAKWKALGVKEMGTSKASAILTERDNPIFSCQAKNKNIVKSKT